MGNNPIKYVDPTGHFAVPLVYVAWGALVAGFTALTPPVQQGLGQIGDYVQQQFDPLSTMIDNKVDQLESWAIGVGTDVAIELITIWYSDSKTHWKGDISIPGGGTAPGRLDSEPYGDGRRIHLQWTGSKEKYYYDPVSKAFVDAAGKLAP